MQVGLAGRGLVGRNCAPLPNQLAAALVSHSPPGPGAPRAACMRLTLSGSSFYTGVFWLRLCFQNSMSSYRAMSGNLGLSPSMWAMSCFQPLRYLNPFMGHPDHVYEAAGQAAPGALKLFA